MLDIDFGPTGDDNLEPRNLCSGIGQDPQDTWSTSSVATLVKCINDKNESVIRVARNGVEEVKQKRAIHRARSEVRVVTQVLCYNGSKRGDDHVKILDESWKDVHLLALVTALHQTPEDQLPTD